MTGYFRIAGALLILVAVLFAGREYSKFVSRRLDQLSGFYSLLEYVESSISKYLSFGRGLWVGFSCEALEGCGFLGLLREGRNPYEAFLQIKSKLSLSSDQCELLEEFFMGFGREYQDGEMKRVSEYRKKLGRILDDQAQSLTNNAKVLKALLLGAGMSLVILVI